MVMHSRKVKLVENISFKDCLIIHNEKHIKYENEKCSVALSNCTIVIEDEEVISKDYDDCIHIDDCFIIIKKIKSNVDNRADLAKAIVPIISDDNSDDGADCHLK